MRRKKKRFLSLSLSPAERQHIMSELHMCTISTPSALYPELIPQPPFPLCTHPPCFTLFLFSFYAFQHDAILTRFCFFLLLHQLPPVKGAGLAVPPLPERWTDAGFFKCVTQWTLLLLLLLFSFFFFLSLSSLPSESDSPQTERLPLLIHGLRLFERRGGGRASGLQGSPGGAGLAERR